MNIHAWLGYAENIANGDVHCCRFKGHSPRKCSAALVIFLVYFSRRLGLYFATSHYRPYIELHKTTRGYFIYTNNVNEELYHSLSTANSQSYFITAFARHPIVSAANVVTEQVSQIA